VKFCAVFYSPPPLISPVLSLSSINISHWYVSGYNLGFENFQHHGNMENLFTDVGADASMFRIVCKSNLTYSLAEDLVEQFVSVLGALDSLQDGYRSLHTIREALQGEANETAMREGITEEAATSAIVCAGKWLKKTRANMMEQKKAHRRSLSSAHPAC